MLGLVAVLAIELTTQVLATRSQKAWAWLSAEPPLRSDPQLGYRPNPLYWEHDSNGFRNALVPTQLDVVVLGDSQTYGVNVTRDEAWPQQLAQLGYVRTYNMGVPGYGPVHSLSLLQEAIALRPGLIIEAFYSGNDLHDSYAAVYRRKPLLDRRKPQGAKILEQKFLTTRSKIGRLLEGVKHQYLDLGSSDSSKRPRDFNWQAIRLASRWHGSDYQLVELGDVRTVLRPAYRLRAMDLDDPRIVEGLRISLETMQCIQQRAQAAQVAYAVLLIPAKELVYADMVPAEARSPVYAKLLRHSEELSQLMKAFLEQRDIQVIDALPVLKASVERQEPPYFMRRDGHPNATGHRLIAELVYSAIKRPGEGHAGEPLAHR